MTKLDQENVWKIIKKIRLSFLSEYSDIDCNSLLPEKNIQDNINSIASQLHLNTTSTANQNVSFKTLRTAGEMFIYLNYCPPYIPINALLCAYLFKTGTPREIILALTSVMKSLENAEEKKEIIEVFFNIMNTLNLKEFEIIQISTKGNCYTNAIMGNCTKKMNLNNKKIQGFLRVYNSEL